ncbi:MAG: Cof-type HAD-IIB family hydrolase [Coprobacillaceae bacterium]
MGYKLIACDLDETLLDDSHKIPQNNLDAIARARKEYGVKFVPATGRGYSGIKQELLDLGLYDMPKEYTISFNGGALTENKGSHLISFKGLSFEKTKEIFEFGLQCNVCQHVYTKDTLYVFNISDSEFERFKNQGVEYENKEENSIDFLKDEPISKILYQNVDVPYLMSLEPQMKHITDGCVAVSYSSNRYIEFNQLGVDKGQGLIDLAKLLNIDIKDTIAVGDNYNDMAMLKVAGLSVAANNAVDDIKAICDVTTKANNNEGVIAELIERFIFNNEV